MNRRNLLTSLAATAATTFLPFPVLASTDAWYRDLSQITSVKYADALKKIYDMKMFPIWEHNGVFYPYVHKFPNLRMVGRRIEKEDSYWAAWVYQTALYDGDKKVGEVIWHSRSGEISVRYS